MIEKVVFGTGSSLVSPSFLANCLQYFEKKVTWLVIIISRRSISCESFIVSTSTWVLLVIYRRVGGLTCSATGATRTSTSRTTDASLAWTASGSSTSTTSSSIGRREHKLFGMSITRSLLYMFLARKFRFSKENRQIVGELQWNYAFSRTSVKVNLRISQKNRRKSLRTPYENVIVLK